MGAKTASLVMVKGPPGEKVIARPYTPTTLNGNVSTHKLVSAILNVFPCVIDQKGYFELVVKAYPQGVVSTYLHSLKARRWKTS